ncbi:PAS domain-containing protein [Oceanicella sp. SM1341]|uniref:PAS domain-containing protein n=1 Tax=Oceanicella sp. SM1341 TaxID=1548889 RepID=UPI000E543E66|nr:PAS domain-containing protein [Oceanicella sp. SM1341]
MRSTLFNKAGEKLLDRIASPEMLDVMDQFDWSATPLGPVREWSGALCYTVRMMLSSRTAMAVMVGREGILLYNDAYARIAGSRHPDILGRPTEEAWPEVASFNRDLIDRVLEGETVSFDNQRLTLNRGSEPEDMWFDLEYGPVLNRSGQPIAVLARVIDVTDKVRAEDALARSEERMELALESAGLIGVWDWDVVADRIVADQRFARMFWVDPEEAARGLRVEAFLAALHPDDDQRLRAAMAESMERGKSFAEDFRLRSPRGQIRWVNARGDCTFDDSGRCVRFTGVAVDLTDRRQAEDALRESEQRFRALADSMPQMIWTALPDGRHDYYNARWYQFSGGEDPGAVVAEDRWESLLHPEDREAALENWERCLSTGEVYEDEYRLRDTAGHYPWILARAVPMRDRWGRVTRWFGTFTDINEQRIAAEEREVIAQELSHRIKNIYSVLSGLISLSARSYPGVRDFAEQLRQRIFAMGQAHDLVRPHSNASQPHVGDTTLHTLIAKLLGPFMENNSARVQITGEDLKIDDQAATPMALLVHELATNAAKYGGLTPTGGGITVDTRLEGDRVHLLWCEQAVPGYAAEGMEAGFGSRLISLSIEGQMRGRFSREWTEEGLRMSVDVPLTALRRAHHFGASPAPAA